MQKERNSSLELLRIIAMLFIICSHCCVFSGFDAAQMEFSFNKIVLQTGVLGNLGVDIFVMLSGYFLIDRKFNVSRIVKIELQVLFYSVSIYAIAVAFNMFEFSAFDAIRSLFPIIFGQYWFATVYVIFSILTPFINLLLNKFTKKQFEVFLIVIFALWSIIPTFTAQMMYGFQLEQFLLFYALGAYGKKYSDGTFLEKHRYLVAVVAYALLVLSTVILDLLSIYFPIFNEGTYFYLRTSVLIIMLSYSLLLMFANFKSYSSKAINIISATTFGVYLIHENDYLREFVWQKLFKASEYTYSPYLIFYLIFCVLAVFVTCGIIEYARIRLIEKPLMKILASPMKKINTIISDYGF